MTQIEVSRNGAGIHVGGLQGRKGAMYDLTEDEARELAALLTEALTADAAELTYLNMEQIANLMRRDHGVEAFVENTGGGVMCLFAGPTHVRESDGAELHALCFGPGRLVMDDVAVADRDEVCWGPDGDDDDALTALRVFPDWQTITEAEVATTLANFVRMASA